MSRKMQTGRIAGPAGLAVAVLTAFPMLVSPGAAQQSERERPILRGLFPVTQEREARPRLGVLIARGDDDRVLVADVLANSPAEEAGIMGGDVILSVNGHELSEPLKAEDERDFDPDRSLWPGARLRALVGRVPGGETVTLAVERDGEHLEMAVVPRVASDFGGWWPDSGWDEEGRREVIERWSDPSRTRGALDRVTHGLDLVELNPGLGAYFGTSEGVLVADVEEDSPLGLRPGDVVVAVDGRVVDDIDELRRILRSYEHDEEIAFRIYRDGAEATVTGTIS